MAFIKTTTPAEATGDIEAMYRRQQDSWGYVPDYARVFSERPEVLARWGRLLAEIRRPMSGRRFELATFAAAVELRHSACSLAHGRKLLEFFSADDVIALRNGQYPGSVTESERAVMEFARKVARDASKITSGDVARLRKFGLTDGEVFDVVAAAAGRAFFTKMLDALGVEPDSAFMAMDYDLRQALTVGRPIGFRPVERMPEIDNREQRCA